MHRSRSTAVTGPRNKMTCPTMALEGQEGPAVATPGGLGGGFGVTSRSQKTIVPSACYFAVNVLSPKVEKALVLCECVLKPLIISCCLEALNA